MSKTKDYLEIIKESFDPQLIAALYKNFTDQYVALQELIDNAVDDKIEGRTLTITIDYDKDDNKLTIKNNNGKGMDTEDLVDFFTWGLSEKKGRIGRYGQGGKAALGYLAKSFIIKSHPKGSEDSYCIKVDDWEDREEGFKEFKIEAFGSLHDKDKGAVNIEISNLRKRFSIDTVKEKIAKIYRPLIVNNKVDFYVNGDKISCPAVNYDEGTKKNFELDFEFEGRNYIISGDYGIVSDIKSLRGGFRIFVYGRCVTEKEYFGQIDPSTRGSLERLSGELYINFDLPLLMNKTDVDRDSGLWRIISKIMYDEIEATVKLAYDYRSASSKEIKAAEKIGKKIKKKDGREDVDITLANYGAHLLFKVEKDKNGRIIIKINRDHKAYQKWGNTEYGKKLYAVMIYSLFEAVEKLPKKEAAKFINIFSESLKEHTCKLL